jgi:glycerophosphoryl diester phosphodiesterase
MRRRELIAGAGASAVLAGCASMSETQTQAPAETRRPVVIAHRGCSGERPEHTMAAYRRAAEQGADYVEIDVVMTLDGVLVCRHENELSGTTDVAAHTEFAARRVEKTVDGVAATGWWIEDFTLAELKTLRCKERLPQLRPANVAFDGQDPIVTFAEVLALSAETNIGVYCELKHPTYLRGIGLDPLPALAADVRAAGGQSVADKIVVQAFEVGALRTLAEMSSIRWTCTQLVSLGGGPWDRQGVTYAQMLTDEGLREIATYARGLGADNVLIFPRNDDLSRAPATDLVARAHAAGLVVHPWTLRAENFFLPPNLRRGDPSAPNYLQLHGDAAADAREFYAAGVDGVITDFPATAVAARS